MDIVQHRERTYMRCYYVQVATNSGRVIPPGMVAICCDCVAVFEMHTPGSQEIYLRESNSHVYSGFEGMVFKIHNAIRSGHGSRIQVIRVGSLCNNLNSSSWW